MSAGDVIIPVACHQPLFPFTARDSAQPPGIPIQGKATHLGWGFPPAVQGPGAELRHSAWSPRPPSPTRAFVISPVSSRPPLGLCCGRNYCPTLVLQLSWRRDLFSPGLTFPHLTSPRVLFPRRRSPLCSSSWDMTANTCSKPNQPLPARHYVRSIRSCSVAPVLSDMTAPPPWGPRPHLERGTTVTPGVERAREALGPPPSPLQAPRVAAIAIFEAMLPFHRQAK